MEHPRQEGSRDTEGSAQGRPAQAAWLRPGRAPEAKDRPVRDGGASPAAPVLVWGGWP